VLLIGLVALAACDRGTAPPPAQTATQTTAAPKPEPGDIALAYYAALAESKFADAHAMVNDADRAARPLSEFEASAGDPLQVAILRARKYQITATKVDGDTARVSVDSTGPDIAKLQPRVISKLVKEMGSVPESPQLKEAMRDAVLEPDAPTIVTRQQVFLVRDNDGWKLDFDWDVEHPQRAVPVQDRPDAGAASAAGDQ